MVSVERLTELLDAFQNAAFDSKLRAAIDLDNALRNAAPELLAVVEAARAVKQYDEVGGDWWWDAHARLYKALHALDATERTDK